MQEREQPDPALQMSTGRVGVAGWAIFAVIAVVILTAVLYGLNGPSETPTLTAGASSTPAAPNTSPAPTSTDRAPSRKPLVSYSNAGSIGTR